MKYYLLISSAGTLSVTSKLALLYPLGYNNARDKTKTVTMYQTDNLICPFVTWLESLDASVRHRVKARLARVSLGNYGDHKPLGEGLSELRFKFGSGYRVYFSELEGEVVLLLCGGDKNSQKKDITLARKYLTDYLRGKKSG